MQENNYFKLGLFVICSFILLLVVLIMLGIQDEFQPKAYIATTVSESVQGLTRGSAVKCQGVPLGKVTGIMMGAGPEGQDILIQMEIDLKNIYNEKMDTDHDGKVNINAFYDNFEKAIRKQGIRCRLEPDGITGMKYVEFFVKEKSTLPENAQVGFSKEFGKYFYVPSSPSIINDLRTSIVSILEKIDSVDYNGISNQIKSSLAAIDKFLTNPSTKNILDNLSTATKDVTETTNRLNKTLSEERMNKIITSTENTIASVKALSDKLNSEVEKAEIGKTGNSIRYTVDSLKISSDKFTQLMIKLDGTIGAVQELIRMLNNDPASLIHGKTVVEPDLIK